MDIPGISGAGAETERLYLLHTGARRPGRRAEGDADLDGHLIEIKHATSKLGRNGRLGAATINQIRAVKYTTMVVRHLPADTWYVVPALEIVRLMALKGRGQHCENPFETNTLSTNHLSAEWISKPSDLRRATLDAVEASESRQDIKEAMAEILGESKILARRSVEQIQALLAG